MPELPEVETVIRDLRPSLVGSKIIAFENNWRNCLRGQTTKIKKEIIGRRIESVTRRGKYIIWHLDNNKVLILHLKMSGRFWFQHTAEEKPSHVHTSFYFDGDHVLYFRDPRKFGRVYYVNDAEEVVGKLGPEPLERSFNARALGEIIDGKKTNIKGFLLNQERIAGIGNIYADESLFLAGIRPDRNTSTITENEIELLAKGIKKSLRHGITNKGADLGDNVYTGGSFQFHFAVYGRTGEPCRRCGTPIERIKVAARSTHFCPKCQK